MKETEAAALLENDPFDSASAEIHQLLAVHFASREQLSKKLKINDPEGAKWSQRYRSHPDYKSKCWLTAALIVKDEEMHIARCLKSLTGVVDEVILVDTGSTDRTLAIVRYLDIPNLRLTKFDWCDDFSAARNFALDAASSDWILWIDADEELKAGSQQELLSAVVRPHFGGFSIPIVNFTADYSDTETYTHAPVRLFRHRKDIRFTGKVHEQVLPAISAAGLPVAVMDRATILHHGYRPAEMKRKKKVKRFVSMLESEVKEHPNSGFQWFNLANAYCVEGDLDKQEHGAKMAVKLLANDDPILPLAVQLLAAAETALKKPKAALEAIAQAIERGLDERLISFECANAHVLLGEFDEALAAINKCFEFEWQPETIGDKTMVLYKRDVVKGQILSALERYDEAQECLDRALAVQPSFEPAIFHRAGVLANTGRLEEAIAAYESLTHSGTLIYASFLCLGRCHMRQETWSDAARSFETACRMKPEEFDDWALWAESAERSGDPIRISTAFEAFAAHPEPNHSVLVNWGRCLAANGDVQRALECYESALKLAPDDANARFNCGDLLYKMGQFRDAAHLYQSALEIDKDNVEGWFVLGNALAMLNLIEGAEIAYAEVLKRDPNHNGALTNRQVLRAA